MISFCIFPPILPTSRINLEEETGGQGVICSCFTAGGLGAAEFMVSPCQGGRTSNSNSLTETLVDSDSDDDGWRRVSHNSTLKRDDCNTASVKHVEDSNTSGNVQQAAVDGPQKATVQSDYNKKVNRMLIDGGFGLNILPLRVMKKLGVPIDELGCSRLMIQGFSQEGQRALGTIMLDLLINEMTSTMLFHVIDAKTSYNMLLGRPWLHENGVITSTLHQCFKYFKDGHVKRVFGNATPFIEAESCHADAKYYFHGTNTTKIDKSASKDEKDLPPSRTDKGKQVVEDDDRAFKGLTLPQTKLDDERPSSQPLEVFTRPIRGART